MGGLETLRKERDNISERPLTAVSADEGLFRISDNSGITSDSCVAVTKTKQKANVLAL